MDHMNVSLYRMDTNYDRNVLAAETSYENPASFLNRVISNEGIKRWLIFDAIRLIVVGLTPSIAPLNCASMSRRMAILCQALSPWSFGK